MKHENAIAQIHGLIDDCAAHMRELANKAAREGLLDDIPPEHEPLIAKALLIAILRTLLDLWQALSPEARRLVEKFYRELATE